MAGARSNRRAVFFREHPWCCFCGGTTAATTEDHFPGRSVFLGRNWPVGYVFPACTPCNNESSRDECLMAWVVRILYSMDLPEEVIGVVARYGGKLGKALHYRHTRRIVSTSAAVDSRVFTNLNALGSAFPRAALSLLQNEVEIQRAPTSLKSQFDYRFAVVEEGESSGFVISFGESLVLVVLIFLDRVRFEATQAAKKNSEQMQTTGVA